MIPNGYKHFIPQFTQAGGAPRSAPTVLTRLAMAAYCLRDYDVEIDDLHRIGDIQITCVGQENIYFTSLLFGTNHVCKVYNTKEYTTDSIIKGV